MVMIGPGVAPGAPPPAVGGGSGKGCLAIFAGFLGFSLPNSYTASGPMSFVTPIDLVSPLAITFTPPGRTAIVDFEFPLAVSPNLDLDIALTTGGSALTPYFPYNYQFVTSTFIAPADTDQNPYMRFLRFTLLSGLTPGVPVTFYPAWGILSSGGTATIEANGEGYLSLTAWAGPT